MLFKFVKVVNAKYQYDLHTIPPLRNIINKVQSSYTVSHCDMTMEEQPLVSNILNPSQSFHQSLFESQESGLDIYELLPDGFGSTSCICHSSQIMAYVGLI